MESVEQIHLFRWADLQSQKQPLLSLLYHIPNGGHRHITTARRLKAEGVKSGVPDLCLPVSRQGKNGLYIELKRKGNAPSDNQRAWLTALRDQGYAVAVCYNWQEAAQEITDYLRAASDPRLCFAQKTSQDMTCDRFCKDTCIFGEE